MMTFWTIYFACLAAIWTAVLAKVALDHFEDWLSLRAERRSQAVAWFDMMDKP